MRAIAIAHPRGQSDMVFYSLTHIQLSSLNFQTGSKEIDGVKTVKDMLKIISK
jgi:hypothetical protein